MGNELHDINDLIMKADRNVRFADVVLEIENREKIERLMLETQKREKLRKYRLKPLNTMLFTGESGCGKTYVTQAIANELGFEPLMVDIGNAIATGKVFDNLKRLFEYANVKGNCVIFLDECDSIAWTRDKGDSDDIHRMATNSLFQHMDRMNKDNIIIGATNLRRRLDSAFERRFEEVLTFIRPSGDKLDELIHRFMYSEFKYEEGTLDEQKKAILQQRIDISYDTVRQCIERVMKDAVMNDTTKITDLEMYRVLKNKAEIKMDL